MTEPIRVCIGTEPKTAIACKVLRHSIRANVPDSVALEFHELTSVGSSEVPGGLTGFSMQRWTIAERFGFQGRAIYLDADQIVMADIRDLWNAPARQPDDGASVWCVYRHRHPATSVMLIDCGRAAGQWPRLEALARYLGEGPAAERPVRYRKVMRARLLATPPCPIEPGWNHLDRFIPGETRLLHFTDLSRQPWHDPDHPLAFLWRDALTDALAAGAVSADELRHACADYRRHAGGAHLAGVNPRWLDVLSVAA